MPASELVFTESLAGLGDARTIWRAQGSTREIEGFDRTLAAGRAVIERHLREIDRLEREAEIDRFSRALAADAILPEDFTS